MKKTIIVLAFYYSLFITHYSLCQWVWVNPQPTGSKLYSSFFINSLEGYSVGEAGAFIKTTDGGLTWKLITINVNSDFRSVYFTDSLNGTIAGTSGYILKTTNGGYNWINQKFNDTVNFNCLSFLNSSVGFAVTDYWAKGRIYKTTNGGTNWLLKYTYTYENIRGITALNANIIYAVGYKLFLRSTDGGETWVQQNVPSVDSIDFMNIRFIDSQTGFATGAYYSDFYFFKTVNGGNNWSKNYISTEYPAISFRGAAFINASTGFVCGLKSDKKGFMYRTTNAGNNWSRLILPDSSKELCSVSSFNNGLVVTGELGTILRSDNWGNSFTKINKSISENSISAVSFSDTLCGTVVGMDGSIFRTTNKGANWIQQSCGITSELTAVKMLNQNTGYIASNNGSVFKTTNGGNNWTNIFRDSTKYWLDMDFSDVNNGIVVGGSARAQTSNGGINWTISLSGTNGFGATKVAMGNNNNICMIGYQPHPPYSSSPAFWATTNGGASWPVMFEGQWGEINLTSVSYADSNNAIISGGYGYLFRTYNGFRNYINWGQSPYGNPLRSITMGDSLNVLAIKYDGTIVKSTNGGLNFYPSCYVNENISNLKFFKNGLAVGTGYGASIIMSGNPGIIFSGVNNQGNNIIPEKFTLYQNYPNPFNPTTSIKYQVESVKQIKLVVFDILGKEITTLVNEKQSPGTYEVTFDGSALPSGVYFYKLIAGDFSETKKALLIK